MGEDCWYIQCNWELLLRNKGLTTLYLNTSWKCGVHTRLEQVYNKILDIQMCVMNRQINMYVISSDMSIHNEHWLKGTFPKGIIQIQQTYLFPRDVHLNEWMCLFQETCLLIQCMHPFPRGIICSINTQDALSFNTFNIHEIHRILHTTLDDEITRRFMQVALARQRLFSFVIFVYTSPLLGFTCALVLLIAQKTSSLGFIPVRISC